MLGDLRAGEPFTTAMERLAVRVPVPAVVRFVDGLVVAVERGTPLGTCSGPRRPTSASSTNAT